MKATLLKTLAVVSAFTFAGSAQAADEHGHDHDAKPAATLPSVKDDHDDHAGHDHGAKPDASKPGAKDVHDDHAHGEEAHSDEVKLSEAAVKQSGIVIVKATKRSLASSIVAPARVAFDTDAMAHVGSAVQGRVIEISVKVGDVVKKSDVLAVVESPELGRSQSMYLQRRTEAEVAAAGVAPAKDAFERAKKLFDESQGIALSEVQKREVEYRSAAGVMATSKAAMQAAENELHLLGITQDQVKKLVETGEINPRFTLRAPMDGRVIEREVTLGELVSPDKEKLMVLANTSVYWVWADVPEARLGDIGVGSKADITVTALPGVRITGEVSLVASEVDPNTRSARVRMVVDNTNDKLKPGMFARVTLFAGDGEAVLAIPEESVQTTEGKPSVFVPVDGAPNTFARREVTVGKPVSGYVPVMAGLKEAELLVASGSFILKAELGKSEASHEH